MDAETQIEKFKEFFEIQYYDTLLDKASRGEDFIIVGFPELAVFDPQLADALLEEPEDLIKAAEYAITRFDLDFTETIRVRFRDLPHSSNLIISEIRSKHIGKFIEFDGIVRQKTDVRPQVTSAKFECPSCGNVLPILQVDTKFKEPSSCSCGRKGKFHMLSRELVDAQKLVVEESPEDLEGGEQPKRMNVFLKNDLVSPISDKKTNPGSKVGITGVLKEVPITLATGGKSTRFDLMIEANFMEPVQEEFTSLVISEEEENELKDISKNPKIYEEFVKSIAPTIYGHERIKEALVLQLFGGAKKSQDDGVTRRSDIHVLLIGDPGSGKSQLIKRMSHVAPKSRFVSGKGASGAGLCVSPDSFVLTNPGGMSKIKDVVDNDLDSEEEFRPGVWKGDNSSVKIQSMNEGLKLQSKKPSNIWKLQAPEYVYEVLLSSGKKIELTANTKLLSTLDGDLKWIKSKDLKKDSLIATPRRLIGGEDDFVAADFIKSNPPLLEMEGFVRDVKPLLRSKYGDLRKASEELSLNENYLYHNWVEKKAKGKIRLDDLRRVCSSLGLPLKGVNWVSLRNGKKHKLPSHNSKEFLYFAGLIAGDGDIQKRSSSASIRFSNSSEELINKIKVLFEDLRLNYDIQKKSSSRPAAIRTSSKLISEILEGFGIPKSPKSQNLAMSNELLHLKNDLLAEYIAGLYDSDGSFVKRSTGSDLIEFTTVSEVLVRQLQQAFLRYRIYPVLRERSPSVNDKVKGRLKKYVLSIRGGCISKFKEHIPIKCSVKKKKLASIVSSNHNTNRDVMPRDLCERLKQELVKEGYSLKKEGWHPSLSNERFKKLASLKGVSDELRKLAFSDLYWESIKEIRVKKPAYDYVYDLTVENSHNFVVNGVLVHNTAAVVKDEFLRGYALEAGALVLANKGLVCIDELDKMSKEDASAMHEALEQQTVSINKANIQATLRSETTVLAAANPKFGRFDPYELLAKQIDLPSTLINRFDLIFPVRDLPDKEKDDKLASFILNLHKEDTSEEVSLETDMIKKYVGYAKQRVRPKLTDEALKEIKEYFVTMRSSGTEEERIQSIPISARQLEGLIRLSEASARTRLSSKVTKRDAKRAIDLLHHCLMLIGYDSETKTFDIDRIATGVSASQRSNIGVIKNLVAELEEQLGKLIPIDDVVREAEIKGVDEEKTHEVLEKLKRSGDLFSPRHGYISRID